MDVLHVLQVVHFIMFSPYRSVLIVQELYSGSIDAEVGVWESSLVYKPVVGENVQGEIQKGQEMLRDIYKAFVDGNPG
jgi:hypothetical protein